MRSPAPSKEELNLITMIIDRSLLSGLEFNCYQVEINTHESKSWAVAKTNLVKPEITFYRNSRRMGRSPYIYSYVSNCIYTLNSSRHITIAISTNNGQNRRFSPVGKSDFEFRFKSVLRGVKIIGYKLSYEHMYEGLISPF
jgi:hypothetical protein